MSRDHGRSPHPAARASSVNATNKPWEGGASGPETPDPADPQAADSTACTSRVLESGARAPVLWNGRLGFAAARYQPEVRVHQLPEQERRYVWRGIKLLAPELAELLRGDPFVEGMREAFDAEISLSTEDYRRYRAAGEAHANGE